MKNIFLYIFLFSNFIFAFYKQDPIVIALSGANSTIAKGFQSIGVNPANIAFDEGMSINILDMNINMHNNFLTKKRIDRINGADLENPDASNYFPKESILGYLNDNDIIFSITSDFSIPAINFSKDKFAITTGIVYFSNLSLSPDILEMFLEGNEIGRKYNLDIKKNDVLILESSFTKAFDFNPIGFGFTIKHLKGLYYYTLEPIIDSYIQTNITEIGAQGQYLLRQHTKGDGLGLDLGFTTIQSKNGWKFGISFINLFANIKWNNRAILDHSLSSFYDSLPYNENEHYLLNLSINNLNLDVLNDVSVSDVFESDGFEVYEVDSKPSGIENQDYYCLNECETYLVSSNIVNESDIVKSREIRIDYPTYMSIGSSKAIDENEFISFDLSLGLDDTFNNKEKWRLSMGYVFGSPKFPIRLGMSYGGYDKKSIGFGCGVILGKFNFDVGIGYNNSFNINKSSGLDFGINMYLMNL